MGFKIAPAVIVLKISQGWVVGTVTMNNKSRLEVEKLLCAISQD